MNIKPSGIMQLYSGEAYIVVFSCVLCPCIPWYSYLRGDNACDSLRSNAINASLQMIIRKLSPSVCGVIFQVVASNLFAA